VDLRALRYFQAVYEQRSVSGAAKQCYVSQPSITTAMQQLEQTLNTRLFDRHARGVSPTSAADKLYPIAKEMSDNAKSILTMFSQGPTPVPLRLGIMRSLGARRMSDLLRQLTQQIDNLELTLVDPEEPCDARVILSPSVTNHEEFIPIWQDNYQLAIPANWALAQQSSIDVTQLDGLAFINRSPCAALELLSQMMSKQKVGFQVRANIRTIEYAWQLVSAGIGAALLPDWDEINQAQGLVLRPINHLIQIQDIGLAFKSKQRNNALISAVIAVCCAKNDFV
jgi:DNA-binding transcriptional LysR family regulator